MDAILAMLDVVIEELEHKSVVLRLKGGRDEPTEVLGQLTEGKIHLRAARRCFGRADFLMQKGYGKLVEPEE